jgi:FkbM family methyltransferase
MRPILTQIFYLWAAMYETYRTFLWKISSKVSKNLTLSVHKNLTLKLVSYGYITKRIYQQQLLVPFKKSFEYDTLTLLREATKSDFQILDIGANIGLHSLIMAQELSDKGKIYAFEPSKKTYDALVENIKLNNLSDKVVPFNLALSNKAETLFLAAPEADNIAEADQDAYNSIHHVQNKKGNAETIDAVTLDSFIEKENIKKIDLIKIDIEGAEFLCFQGAENVIANFRPVIIMECYEPYCNRFNYAATDIILFMTKHNYKMHQYEPNQWIATPK